MKKWIAILLLILIGFLGIIVLLQTIIQLSNIGVSLQSSTSEFALGVLFGLALIWFLIIWSIKKLIKKVKKK